MIEPLTVRLKSPHGLSVLEGDPITVNWHWTAFPDGPPLRFIESLKWYEPLRIWFCEVRTEDPTERFAISIDPRQHTNPPPRPPILMIDPFDIVNGQWRFVDIPACAVFGNVNEVEKPRFDAARFETHPATQSLLAAICTCSRTLNIPDSDVLSRFRGNRNLRGWLYLRQIPNRQTKSEAEFAAFTFSPSVEKTLWKKAWGVKSMIL